MLKRQTWGCGGSRGIHFHRPTPQSILETADWRRRLQPRRHSEPSFTKKTVSFAPANHNAYSHTNWQRYYHLKIIVFFLFVTIFFFFIKGTITMASLFRPVMHLHILTTARDRGTWSSSETPPRILIGMHQLSSYRLLQLLLHSEEKKKKGRQAGTELLHRDIDEKPTAYSMIQLLCGAPGKQERSCTLRQTDLQMWNRQSHVNQPNWYFTSAHGCGSVLVIYLLILWDLKG